jgi:hypothetical protein
MRNGQNNNKRMRGRTNNNNHNNNRKGQNPMSRVYESNGPEVKIRGTPSHIAEKYIQLARDAQSSGDPVSAENFYQHAEHYYRLIAAAQEQFRLANPQAYRPENEPRDDNFEDGDEDESGGQLPGHDAFGTREPQPYLPRDAQPFPQQQQPQPQPQPLSQPSYPQQPQQQPPQHQPRHHQGYDGPRNQPQAGNDDVDRLPSFITGGGGQPERPAQQYQGHAANGHDNQPDRFPLHRRRRRHRGPRNDLPGGAGSGQGGGDQDAPNE